MCLKEAAIGAMMLSDSFLSSYESIRQIFQEHLPSRCLRLGRAQPLGEFGKRCDLVDQVGKNLVHPLPLSMDPVCVQFSWTGQWSRGRVDPGGAERGPDGLRRTHRLRRRAFAEAKRNRVRRGAGSNRAAPCGVRARGVFCFFPLGIICM